MQAKFSVTFERYTSESVENGDAEERRYLIESGTLRECVDEFLELPALDTIEADCCPVTMEHPPRWFQATQGSDHYLYAESDNDEGESRALHIPDSVTPASRIRLARVLGCYGIR